MKLILTNFEPL